MPLFDKNTRNDFAWAIWKTDESSEEMAALLENDYTSECEVFSLENRRREFLAARVLLKMLIGKEERILYTATGKPFLKDNDLQLSISHTKGYVAVIVHPHLPVGIDIEHKSPRVLNIKQRFLDDEELRHVDSHNEIDYLITCWSAKESMFKILNETNIDFKEQLHLKPFDLRNDSKIDAFETSTNQQHTFDIFFREYEDFMFTCICGKAAICGRQCKNQEKKY